MNNAAKVVKVKFLCHSEMGGHVNYEIQVLDVHDNPTRLLRRYRQFRDLHDQIKCRFSNLPTFPPKKFFGNTDPEFLDSRLKDLERYMDEVLALDPRCTALPELAAFLRLPPQLVGEEIDSTQNEPIGQRVLEIAKAGMIDLSMSANDFLQSAEKEQRIKMYGEIIAGAPPDLPAGGSHDEAANHGVPLLHRAVPPHVMRVAERHSKLPVFASLPQDEWLRMVSAPSVVTSGKTQKMAEALQQIAEILDPKRIMESARHIRIVDFLDTAERQEEEKESSPEVGTSAEAAAAAVAV